MYMVRSNVERVKTPPPNATRLKNSLLDRTSLYSSERKWTPLELFAIVALPNFIRRQIRFTIAVVKAVNGTTLVTMQPGAIAAKGNQIGERSVGVVPHDEDEEPF